jgi:hypothetical protein
MHEKGVCVRGKFGYCILPVPHPNSNRQVTRQGKLVYLNINILAINMYVSAVKEIDIALA